MIEEKEEWEDDEEEEVEDEDEQQIQTRNSINGGEDCGKEKGTER